MVAVYEHFHLSLVEFGIPFQPRDSLFDGAPKPGANLKTIIGGAVNQHGRVLGLGCLSQGCVFSLASSISQMCRY
jgi:hypothetical protein